MTSHHESVPTERFQTTTDDLLALTRYWADKWIDNEWGIFTFGRVQYSWSDYLNRIGYANELKRLEAALGEPAVKRVTEDAATRYAQTHTDFDVFWKGSPEAVSELMQRMDRELLDAMTL